MTVMTKRFFFEDTRTVITNRKGWVEVEMDFTQVYDCFSEICTQLKSVTAVKLLFWLLSHEANKSNGIRSGRAVYENFQKHLIDKQQQGVTERTFQNCFEELTSVKALTRVGKGMYYFNPYIFWRDDKNKRIEFITDEKKDKKYISHNPRDKKELNGV